MIVDLDESTISALVAGLYCSYNNVDSVAVPQSVWMSIAEKLGYFLTNELWDFQKISFEEWVRTCLMILPRDVLSDEDIEDIRKNTLYWEELNGNILLSISMDIGVINGV